jgi:hypothetical protein
MVTIRAGVTIVAFEVALAGSSPRRSSSRWCSSSGSKGRPYQSSAVSANCEHRILARFATAPPRLEGQRPF